MNWAFSYCQENETRSLDSSSLTAEMLMIWDFPLRKRDFTGEDYHGNRAVEAIPRTT